MPNFTEISAQAAIAIAPELILIATVCVMLLVGPFLTDSAGRAAKGLSQRWTILSLLAFAVAGWTLYSSQSSGVIGPFNFDGLSQYVRILTLVIGPVLAIIASRQIDDGHSAESHACLLTILAGANLTALASDLIGLFLALELVSIPTYIFLYLPRRNSAMQEAALKYFLLSVFSSALVLFGMSWLYGVAGSTNFGEISAHLAGAAKGDQLFALLAMTLIVAGLCFRIAAVPFHFYAPDVFQGVTSAGAAMLSVAPKIVGFAALVRLAPLAMTGASAAPLGNLLAVTAIVTMFLGNLLALRQKNLQRLLAYSSIAHSGYMLVGLAAGNSGAVIGGDSSLWFYLATYGLVTAGLFALLAGVGGQKPLERDSDLGGLGQSRPAAALLIAVCLFSMTGLPPTAGFTGKLHLFFASWASSSIWGQWLAVALAINSAIAAYYYLRLIAVMYLDESAKVERQHYPISEFVGGACAVGTIALFISPDWLWQLAKQLP